MTNNKRITMIKAAYERSLKARKHEARKQYLYIKPAIVEGLIGKVSAPKLSTQEKTFALTSSHSAFLAHIDTPTPIIHSGHDVGSFFTSPVSLPTDIADANELLASLSY